MITLCPEGKDVEITIENEKEKNAYEEILDYYNGNKNRAYEAFYGWYRSDDEQLLRDRISSYVMEGFTISQQQHVVDVMKWYTMQLLTADNGQPISGIMVDGYPQMGRIKSATKNFFDNQLRDKHKNSELRQDLLDQVLENFDQFWRRNHQTLKNVGLEVNSNGQITSIAGGDFVRRNWDDNARFEIDPKDTSSSKVKATLSFIPKVEYKRDESGSIIKDENGVRQKKVKDGFFGPEFASMDTIHDNIGAALSDFVPPSGQGKFDAYIEHLREQVDGNAQMERAVEEIVEQEKKDETLRFDFVNAFGKTYTKNLTVTFKPNVSVNPQTGRSMTSGWTMRIFDTNRTSQKNAIKQDWFENQKVLPIVTQDQDGDLRIDRGAVEDLRNQYINDIQKAYKQTQNKKSDEVLEIIQQTLRDVGITVPMGVLSDIAQNPKKVSSKKHTWNYHIFPNNGGLNQNGLMGVIFDTLGKDVSDDVDVDDVDEYGKLGLNNPIYGRDSQGMIDRLASLTADKRTSVYAPSYINGENNQEYALQDHTVLTQTLGRLQQNPENALNNQGVFNRTSRIRKALVNDTANIRETLDLHYIDTLKEYRRKTGTTYDAMSTVEKELTRLSLFQKAQRNNRSRFLSPTLSDKTRDYIVTLPMVQELYGREGTWTDRFTAIDEDGNLDLYTEAEGEFYHGLPGRVMYDIAKGEINRIIQMQQWLQQNDRSDHPLGEDYVDAAQRFFLFPDLNPENLSSEDRQTLYRTDESNEIIALKDPQANDSVEDTIKRVLLDSLEQKVEQTKERWRDLDIIKDGDPMMDSTYLKSIPYGQTDSARKITYAALDYQLGYHFFNANILQLLPGDPAQHVKGNLQEQDPFDVHEQTMTNLQKRLASHIAPSLTADWALDQQDVKILTMNDRIVASKHWDQYKEMLDGNLIDLYGEFDSDGNLVDGIESTDAQEYTTLKEHLIVARSHGKVKKDVFDALIDKIDEVRQDPENENNYFRIEEVFEENDLSQDYEDFYLMPHKPVYVGEHYYEHLNSSHAIYRKTSSWPLIPEMVRGTDLDNLRLAMEGNGQEEKVQRAAFQTADKLGAYNPQDVFDESERKQFRDSDALRSQFKDEGDVDNLNDMNIQTVSRDNLGLQFELPYNDKGVKYVSQMNRLIPQDIAEYQGFDIEGESLSGRQVEQKKQEYRKEMFDIAKERLFDELNVAIDSTDAGDVLRFENMEALQQILQDEAEARDWDPSAMDALELTDEGEFVIPLSFVPNTESIESLLNSLIKNRIIEQRMYGSSYVQTTGAGWHGIGNNSPIAVTESYDPEMGLQHVRMDDNGDVQPAQVMIPWNFKDSEGNLLPINQFTTKTEDGRRVIDDEKLDPELRKIIGARIPYQSKSSSMPIEVVGFLPPTVKKLMVVSDETVAQMGSDFDVDKVTTYEKKYTETPDGRLAESSVGDSNMNEMDGVKSKYMDLHWEILTHPDVMDQVIQPLDSPYLSDIADEIESLKPGANEQTDFLNPHQQVDDHNNQQAGNDLIGIFSNFSNLNAMMEPYPQDIVALISTGSSSTQVPRVVKYRQQREDGGQSTYRLHQMGGENVNVTMPDGSEGTIADVLEMLQNSSLDNATELVLDKINATTNTANVISALAMMHDQQSGIPIEMLAKFFAQPSIKKLDEEINRLRSQLNNEFITEDVQYEAIKNVLNDLATNYAREGQLEALDEENLNVTNVDRFDRINEFYNKLDVGDVGNVDMDKYRDIYESLSKYTVDRDRMQAVAAEIPTLNALTNALKRPFDSDNSTFIQTQRDVLDAYLGLYEISKGLQQLQGTVNWGNRNGPGKSLMHSLNKVESLKNLSKNQVFSNPMNMIEDSDGELTEWGSAANNSFVLANKLYADLFHYNKTLFDTVRTEMNQKTEDGIGPDKALEVFRNLRSFVYSTDGFLNMEGVTVDGERNRLLFGENNIAEKVKQAQEEWGNNHFFIQRLRPEQPESPDDPAVVNYSADKGERLDEIRVIQDFAGLLVSNDDRKRELAQDLVRYSFLVGGGVQSPTSFHNKVPIGYLIEQGLKEYIDDFDFSNNKGLSDRFKQQYYQHNPTDARVLTDSEQKIIKSKQEDSKLLRLDLTDPNRLESMWEMTPMGPQPKYEYISRYDNDADRWRLYRMGSQEGMYYEIDLLGQSPSVKEYSVDENKTIGSSLIEDNHSRLDYNPFDTTSGVSSTAIEKSPTDHLDNKRITGQQFIDSVKDHVDNPYVQDLIEYVENLDSEFTIEVLDDSEMSDRFGSNLDANYEGETPNIIYLNKDSLQNRGDEEIARAVLHEWIHKKTYEVYRKDQSERTDRQNDLMLNLYNLMNEAVQKDPNGAPRGMFRYKDDGSREPIFMEFLAWGVANREGQKWLQGIDSDQQKNLLERVIDQIVGVINSLIESVGYDISPNSSLRYTIRDTINLIETTRARENVDSNPEGMTKEERAKDNEQEGSPTEKAESAKDAFEEAFNDAYNQQTPLEQQTSLNKTIGELRSSLTDRQKKIFDKYRNRFQTEC